MLCFSTPHFQTRCGLAVLNLRKGYGPPFAKNRTSFTTSDASDAENRRPAALPYAGCAPYSTGTEKQLSPSRSPQNRPRPRFAPRRPLVAEQAMACSGRNPRVRSTRLFLSEKHRVSPPREGLCGEFTPQVGNGPVPARSGAGLGHTEPSLAERKENGPTWKTAHNVDSEYVGVWLPARRVVSPKTSSGERCEKQAGERPGVAGGVPCRVTSPGRAGR